MLQPRKLLFLGAGIFHVPAILRARELGYHVITLDYLPKNIGHRYSNQSINCSTTDVDGVLHAAIENGIDGIFTFASDIALPSVAHVAQQLGLPGVSPGIVRVLTQKHRFREFQKEALGSDFVCAGAGTWEECESIIVSMNKRLVIKPVDSSGSKGIAFVDSGDLSHAQAAFKEAMTFSREGSVCLEEYIDGDDVTAEGFVEDGRVSLMAVSRKFRNGFAVYGHYLDRSLKNIDYERIANLLSSHFQAIEYDHGPFDADLRISRERAVVLEMSPRLGGNGIALAAGVYLGVDLLDKAIRQAMGETFSMPSSRLSNKPCGSFVLGSVREGRVAGYASVDQIRAAVEGIAEIYLDLELGKQVHSFVHGGHAFGYCIFETESEGDFHTKANEITRALALKVENDG